MRAGFSRRNPHANSNTSAGVRAEHCRGLGTRASNPPVRHSLIHRSTVCREIRTGRPNASVCSTAAIRRTNTPRAFVE